jgi:hypothetical protein
MGRKIVRDPLEDARGILTTARHRNLLSRNIKTVSPSGRDFSSVENFLTGGQLFRLD